MKHDLLTRDQKRKLLQELILLYHGKKGNTEIAKQAGASIRQVDNAIRELRKTGDLPPANGDAVDTVKKERSTRKRKNKKLNPQADNELKKCTAENGLRDGFIRQSYIIKKDYQKNIRALAYYDRKKIQALINEVLTKYFETRKDVLLKALDLYNKYLSESQ